MNGFAWYAMRVFTWVLWNGLCTHFATAKATTKANLHIYTCIQMPLLPLPLLPLSVNTCNDVLAIATTQYERALKARSHCNGSGTILCNFNAVATVATNGYHGNKWRCKHGNGTKFVVATAL